MDEVPVEVDPEPIHGGIPVTVTQGVPDAEVIVEPGNKVGKDGQDYLEGDTLTLAGPEAEALVLMGHVRYANN